MSVEILGLKQLRAAINRNPQKVLEEARFFLVRGLAAYKQGIIRDPWRMGGRGGGAPVSNDPRYKRKYQRTRSGNLRDSHVSVIDGLQGVIGPNESVAPYAKFVHHGTRNMQGRPWLDYVKTTQSGAIESLYRKMFTNIVQDLAR